MNKTLKYLLVIVLILVALVALTGCGNKLVATKTQEEGDSEYEEKLEFTFKKDKISKIKATMTFDSKEKAEEYEKDYNDSLEILKSFSDEDVNFPELTVKGKSISMEFTAEEFADFFGVDVDDIGETSKEDLKKELEEDGYKVK